MEDLAKLKEEANESFLSDALLVDFFIAISFLKTETEARLFLSDLLSNHELMQLARRLRVAMMLVSGCSYRTIRKKLGVGLNTIVKVNTWLERQGEGYRMAVSRMAELGNEYFNQKEIDHRDRVSKKAHKRHKYADVFWPVELISAINGEIQKAKKK